MNHRLLLGVALLGVLLTRATDPASAQLRQTTIWDAAAAGSLSDVERAIAEGADVNARDQRGSTPLVYASNAGRVDVAAALLRAGADVDRTNRGRSTPLAFAAAAGHGKLVRLLLRRGANPNSRAPAGVTPLHLAVHFNHPSIARLLLEGGANLHLKARPPEGHPMTPLLVAVDHGHLEMVDLLLSHGAGVRRTGRRELDVFSSTADDAPLRGLPSDAQPETVFSDLKHAFVHAARTERIGVIKRLLTAWRRRRRIPPAADPFKDSELCRAAADGDRATVRRLMSGSDPPPMPELARALHLAQQEGRIEIGLSLRRIAQRRARRAIAEYETEEDLREAAASKKPDSYRRTLALLLRGVNVNAADISGRTALHRAASAGNVEKVDLLLNHGADPGRRDHTGRTPLSRASGDTEHEIIRLLIEHGARPDARTLGRAMAIRAGDATREMIEDLLSRGADPNAAAYTGRTALMHAAEAGNTEVVRLLIERGENVNLTSESGLTARMLAENEFHDRAAAILRDAGAIDRPNVAPNPLYRAINRKDIRRVRRLIAEGVDVNRSGTTDNRSPLWMAVIQGHKRIAGLLLDAGAKAIPVYLLVSRGDGSTRSVQLMRRLIERGADVNARRVIPPRYASDWRWQGATPLMFAAHHGKLSYVQPLLKAGASLDIEDEEGRTALARIFHQF